LNEERPAFVATTSCWRAWATQSMSTCMSPTRRPFELFISYCSCSCCFFDKHALLCLYTIYYKNTLLCLYAIYYQHTLLCLYQFVKMNTAYKHAIFFLFRFVCNAVSMKHFINGCNYPLHQLVPNVSCIRVSFS
jgi:hypothetical protein